MPRNNITGPHSLLPSRVLLLARFFRDLRRSRRDFAIALLGAVLVWASRHRMRSDLELTDRSAASCCSLSVVALRALKPGLDALTRSATRCRAWKNYTCYPSRRSLRYPGPHEQLAVPGSRAAGRASASPTSSRACARREDRLPRHARGRAAARRRRARPTSRATTASRRAGPSNWGRRNPTRDHAVPPGLRPRRDLGPGARAARGGAGGAGGALPLPERQVRRARASSCARRTPTSRATRAGAAPRRCYGEDPFHVGTLATAFTRGLQGDDARYWKTAALLKHFLANSNEDGRDALVLRLRRAAVARVLREAVRDGRRARAARAR